MANSDATYDYQAAGFSAFLTRSIDDSPALNLDSLSSSVQQSTREVNYDQSPTTGGLGSVLRIGNIQLDGITGRISVYDSNNNEVLRLGELDG